MGLWSAILERPKSPIFTCKATLLLAGLASPIASGSFGDFNIFNSTFDVAQAMEKPLGLVQKTQLRPMVSSLCHDGRSSCHHRCSPAAGDLHVVHGFIDMDLPLPSPTSSCFFSALLKVLHFEVFIFALSTLKKLFGVPGSTRACPAL